MKASVFIASSLDGFIARENGSVDWLLNEDIPDKEKEDYGYHSFMESVDALLMGRNSYEMVLSFGGDWHYGKKPVYVWSSKKLNIPDKISDTVKQLNGNVREVIQQLEAEGISKVYVDGGKTIQTFISEGLLDEMIVTVIPILIGSGLPLFGNVPKDIRVEHRYSQSYPNGFVQSKYAFNKE